jgi:hypothetical protein
MCISNHEHASGKLVAIERDVQRAFLNQSTTCRRVVATEERSNPASRFKDVLWGVAPRCIVSIGVKTVFVYDMPPGARLSEVSVLQTLTGRGTNLSCWGEWYRRPKYRAKRTTEMGSREARSVIKWSDSVRTLQDHCCGHVRERVHHA